MSLLLLFRTHSHCHPTGQDTPRWQGNATCQLRALSLNFLSFYMRKRLPQGLGLRWESKPVSPATSRSQVFVTSRGEGRKRLVSMLPQRNLWPPSVDGLLPSSHPAHRNTEAERGRKGFGKAVQGGGRQAETAPYPGRVPLKRGREMGAAPGHRLPPLGENLGDEARRWPCLLPSLSPFPPAEKLSLQIMNEY